MKFFNVGCKLVAFVLALASVGIAQQAAPPSTPDAAQPASAAPAPAAQLPSSTGSAPVAAPPSEQVNTPVPTLRLGNGDLLDIGVYGVTDLSQTIRINDAGDISFPLIGVCHLAGLTTDQARRVLESKLVEGGFLNDPHVSIFVKEYATQGISVMGEVTRPGIYPLLGSPRLFDVIAAAGGLTPSAGRAVTLIHRDHPQEPQTVTFDSDLSSASADNVSVFPGDTVVVSKANLVYVVGDVGLPGGFTMSNNESVSVLQAVALAHGANKTAALGKSKIIRKSAKGYEEVPIPLDKILSAKAPDTVLEAGDIVFVPSSAAKGAVSKTVDSLVQIATGVAIYRH